MIYVNTKHLLGVIWLGHRKEQLRINGEKMRLG